MVSDTDNRFLQNHGFTRDRFRDVSGPVSVDGFAKQIDEIDPNLVVRWQPLWKRYAVFHRLKSGLLRSQPCHIVCDANDGFRKPDSRDVKAIRMAAHTFKNTGPRAWVDHLNASTDAQEAARDYQSDKLLRGAVATQARDADLTTADLGHTRKSFCGQGKT